MARKTDKTKPSNNNPNKFNSIECKPELDWIVSSVSFGRREWFLRLQITGWCPRRLGPFETEGKALYFLDSVLNKLSESIAQAENEQASSFCGRCVVEDELASRYVTDLDRCQVKAAV